MPNGAVCVKLIELGAQILEFDVSDNPTADGLFDMAERDFPTDVEVTRNGSPLNEDTQLYDGDRIFISKKTKGNLDPFEVQFIRMGSGGGITKLPAEDGDTIEKVLGQLSDEEKSSFYRADGKAAYEYRIDTRKVEGAYQVSRPGGDRPLRILLSQKIKGNR